MQGFENISPGFLELIVQNNPSAIWDIVESFDDTAPITSVDVLYDIVWNTYQDGNIERVYTYLNVPFLIDGSEPFAVEIEGTTYAVEATPAHPVLVNYFDGAEGLPSQSIISLVWPNFETPIEQGPPRPKTPTPTVEKPTDWNNIGLAVALFFLGFILIYLWIRNA